MKLENFYKSRYKNLNFFNENLSLWQVFTKNDLEKISLKWLNILEIWVWPHGLIFYIKEKNNDNNCYWLDLSNDVLDKMNEFKINWIKINLWDEKIPFGDNFFDIIIFNEVIEHIFDCQFAINEIYRVLKKWWNLFISTHNTFNIFMRFKFLFWLIPNPSLDVSWPTMWEHIRMFNIKILIKLLINSWFKKSNLINKSWFKLGKISFYTWIFTNLMSRHLYLICKK